MRVKMGIHYDIRSDKNLGVMDLYSGRITSKFSEELQINLEYEQQYRTVFELPGRMTIQEINSTLIENIFSHIESGLNEMLNLNEGDLKNEV